MRPWTVDPVDRHGTAVETARGRSVLRLGFVDEQLEKKAEEDLWLQAHLAAGRAPRRRDRHASRSAPPARTWPASSSRPTTSTTRKTLSKLPAPSSSLRA